MHCTMIYFFFFKFELCTIMFVCLLKYGTVGSQVFRAKKGLNLHLHKQESGISDPRKSHEKSIFGKFSKSLKFSKTPVIKIDIISQPSIMRPIICLFQIYQEAAKSEYTVQTYNFTFQVQI